MKPLKQLTERAQRSEGVRHPSTLPPPLPPRVSAQKDGALPQPIPACAPRSTKGGPQPSPSRTPQPERGRRGGEGARGEQ